MKDKFKVLIVEDEILTATCLKMDLEQYGVYVLNLVTKGENAVMVALQENPSLILMDIRLAGDMDGIEAAEKIIFKKKIPIIFITGYATEFIRKHTEKVHPVDFLEKPVDIKKIKQIIDTLNK